MSTQKPIQRVESHGVMVWKHATMDLLRKTECLCMNCADMKICETAHEGYELCKQRNIAFAVTRCPDFREKRD